jgi:hypothetical protein
METTKFPSLLVGSYKEFGWRYTVHPNRSKNNKTKGILKRFLNHCNITRFAFMDIEPPKK